MPRKARTGVTFDDARDIAGTLPGVVESTMYGTPALKLRGKLVACIASNKSVEPGSLVVRVPFERRDEMVAAAPDAYYFTPHYAGYASVLVRMAKIDRDALRDLLMMSHRLVASESARKKK